MSELVWHELSIPDQQGIYGLLISGKKYCLVVSANDITVTSSRCPHAGADLSQGWCEEQKIVCPFHRHKFDLKSGKGDPGQGNYIHIYPTKLDNDKWYVGLKKSWWKSFF